MKKALWLFLCCWGIQAGFAQQYYRIELLKEGKSIMPSTPVDTADVTWSMRLRNKECMIPGTGANYFLWNSRTNLQLNIDLSDFAFLCSGYEVGDSIQIDFAVTNPLHELYDYAGSRIYVVDQKDRSVDYLGIYGIDLHLRPRITVEDREVCARNGEFVRAMVKNAPKDYVIDWVDGRLEPALGDSARIVGFPGDTTFHLYAVLRDVSGRSLDTGFYTLNLKPLPFVRIDTNYLVRSKGEAFRLTGSKGDNCNHSWSLRQDFSSRAFRPVETSDYMEDHDIEVVLTVTDLYSGCRNMDTAWVYRRPDVPLIDIDTNTMRTDIALKLTDTLKMDSIRVYSIAWDAYNLREEGYRERALLKSTGEMQSWVETDLKDTLRFYYAKAYRNIPGVGIIESASSDTVGYFRQVLLGTKLSSVGGGNNLISILFDMSRKGITTDRELCFKLLDFNHVEQNVAFWKWNMSTNSWMGDSYLSFFEDWVGEEHNLNLGESYLLFVDDITKMEFLTYGKLSPKVKYHFVTGPKGNDNIACLPLHHADIKTTDEIVDRLGHEVTVSYWDFPSQKFVSTFYNPGDPASGIAPSMMGSVPVYPGMPLMINVQQPLDWK